MMSNRANYLNTVLLLFIVSGCSHSAFDSINLDEFQKPPSFNEFNLKNIKSVEPITYLELRSGHDSMLNGWEFSTIASTGVKCADAMDVQACTTDFDALESGGGFGRHCSFDCFSLELAINRKDANFIIDNGNDLISFLGEIDSEEEALLLVMIHGYVWHTEN